MAGHAETNMPSLTVYRTILRVTIKSWLSNQKFHRDVQCIQAQPAARGYVS
jgi:hypothetical protein